MKSFSSSDGCSIRGVPYLQASQPTKKFPRRAIEQLFVLYQINYRKKVSADGTVESLDNDTRLLNGCSTL